MLIELSLGVTAKGLRAKTDRKSAISLQRGQFDPEKGRGLQCYVLISTGGTLHVKI